MQATSSHHDQAFRSWLPNTNQSALLCLFTVAFLLKLTVLLQQPILARDGILHLRFAHDLLENPWASTLKETPFHPGYALTLAVTSKIFQLFDPGPLTPSEWQWCAHLSSSFAGILLVLPLYGLARCFYSVRTAWLSAMLFLMLPSVVRITTDTLTESWYLLFTLSALWTLVLGVRTQRSNWFIVSGLLAGAAYIVRVEAVIILAALVVFTIVCPWLQRRIAPSGCAFRNAALLGFCFLLPPLPYMVTIGKFSNRPAVQTIVQADPAPWFHDSALFASQRLQDGVNGLRIDVIHWADAASLVLLTHLRAGNYFLWLLAALGLVVLWRSRRYDPGILLVTCLIGLHLVMLFRLAATAGYTSERHTLLLVALAAQAAAIGLLVLSQWLKRSVFSHQAWTRAMTVLLILAATALCLPQAVRPLHRNQEPHRQAGLWLAEHLQYNERIVDPYSWASFYAGLTFTHPRAVSRPESTLGVVDPGDADLNRQKDWNQAGLLSPAAITAWRWPQTGKPRLLIRRIEHDSSSLGSTFTY